MKARCIAIALLTLTAVAPAGRSFAHCKLGQLAELPVTMNAFRQPMVSARINGADTQFLVDSGAFYSMISPAVADEFHLRIKPLATPIIVQGTGGTSEASYTTIKNFSLANIPLSNMDFLVVNYDVGDGAAGVLGQNILRVGDVEYDLANGVIRLMRPFDCSKAIMAYWATNTTTPYSVIHIEAATVLSAHAMGVAYLNGAEIRVMFDTGASRSILTLRAAQRAGVKPDSAAAHAAGVSHGVGERPVPTWVAPFASFKIGDEEVRNARLRFGDIELDGVDMLIGADFFLSHRVYVASQQRQLYFTYNGGPVFNLDAEPLKAERATEQSAEPKELLEQPTDAAGFARRGAAFAARRDFDHAIADLTRACELAPNEPRYFYERGAARVGNRQPSQAMADFDQVLKLKPDDVPSLMARARLRLEGRDPSGAASDLDVVDRTVPRESDQRLDLGDLYGASGRLASAITQFDLWLPAHAEDSRRAEALAGRCGARAQLGQDLKRALSDCSEALRVFPNTPHVLESRGLVRQRMGDFDKSIADYDAALAGNPKLAWALYGRGLDELHKGKTTEGQADMARATALQPDVANEAKEFGLSAP